VRCARRAVLCRSAVHAAAGPFSRALPRLGFCSLFRRCALSLPLLLPFGLSLFFVGASPQLGSLPLLPFGRLPRPPSLRSSTCRLAVLPPGGRGCPGLPGASHPSLPAGPAVASGPEQKKRPLPIAFFG